MLKNRKKKYILLYIVVLLMFGIGYAFLTTNLNITGTSTINNPTWDIHWENVVVESGSVTASTPTIDSSKMTVNYSVTFTIPGDYYDFTVDAVNAGTIDGMVSVVSNKLNGTELTTLPNYLEYKVTYEDGVDIAPNQILAANSSEKYKIHVGYKKDISVSDIPTTPQTFNFSFSVTYVQSDSSVVPVNHPITVYTVNEYDRYDSDNNIKIGQSFPAAVTQYNTPQDAMTAFNNRPCYLKHILVNNIVTESYVEFIVTQEMVNNNPGMTPGTYTLRGAGATWNESIGDYNNDSLYYETNKQVLQSAFGNIYCGEDDVTYSCSATGLYAYALRDGNIDAIFDYTKGCEVDYTGQAFCFQ